MPKRDISGMRALVTGASSGIGRAIALELASAGADVAILARRAESLEEAAEAIRAAGRRAVVIAGDVADPVVRTAALAEVKSVLGGLDLLVNNAGVSAHGAFAEADEARLRRIFEVNFFAAAELTREAIPLLSQGRDSMIVNVGSILGSRGIPLNSEYCASKFAMRGWSEALRTELKSRGVGLLLVSPGTTDTEFFDNLLERKTDMPWKEARGVPPEKVARATVRAIRRGKHEITPSWRGWLLVRLNRFSPRLVDWLLGRYF